MTKRLNKAIRINNTAELGATKSLLPQIFLQLQANNIADKTVEKFEARYQAKTKNEEIELGV